jgi:hypothetical protein
MICFRYINVNALHKGDNKDDDDNGGGGGDGGGHDDDDNNNNNNNNNLANMELGHLMTRSSLIHLEVSLMVSLGFFCLLACSILVFSLL